jgi:hypothetical protein
MMVQIKGSRDCGNSPKNTFVQAVAIALETGEGQAGMFDDDVAWQRPSGQETVGREALFAELTARAIPVVLTIDHAISHGKVGAASGESTLADGTRRRFSHVLEFTSAKANGVAVIKTYA